MRILLATLFISCFLLQALALDESFRASLSPDFVHYLEHIGELEVITDSLNAEESKTAQPADGQNTGGLQPYLTDDFSSWLVANGYGGYNFERFDIPGGSYGGKANSSDQITKRPIIFFHGNSDRAMGNVTDAFSGWIDSLIYFTSQGYNKSELYATTWGPNNYTLSHDQYHSYAYLNYLRNFMEAVLNYTQADKVDVMGHSMGVTLARKVIKGGTGFDGSNSYDLGPPLTSRVGKFLSLAGANWGLVSCGTAVPSFPACGQYGFYPGSNATSGPGAYLAALNSDPTKEGDYVISLFSTADDLIQYGDLVWDKYTSQVPTEDDYIIYYNLTHMQVKTTTSAEQYRIITQSHALNIKVLPLYYLAAIIMACLIIN